MALTEIGARLRLAGAPAFKRDADRSADGLDNLARKAKRADRELGGLSGAARRAGSAIGGIGKGATLGGLGALTAGVGALSVGLLQGFRDAASMQTMLAKTNAVIASTSGVANVSAASVLKMSDQLESLSMMDQEAILNGQNLLLTFTNIRNGVGQANHIFDQATVAMVNLATALGSDPQSAAIQLGKALNDPVKGLTALGRAGVQFSTAQKDQIKSLVAAGKTMDAQKVILKELEVQFGGAAKAAGSGFEGAMFRAKDALGDLFRDVATPLLPGFTERIEGLSTYLTNTATPAILDFVEGFQNGSGSGGAFREDLLGVWEAAKDLGEGLQFGYEKTKQVVDFLQGHPDTVKTFAVGVAAYATAMKAAAVWTSAMAAIDLFKLAAGMTAVNAAGAGGVAGAAGAAGKAGKGGLWGRLGAGAGGAAAGAKGIVRRAGIAGLIGTAAGAGDSAFIDWRGRYRDTVLPDGRIQRFDGKTGQFTILPAPAGVRPRPGGSSLDRLSPTRGVPLGTRPAATGRLEMMSVMMPTVPGPRSRSTSGTTIDKFAPVINLPNVTNVEQVDVRRLSDRIIDEMETRVARR